jgi:hypothetical protein
MERVSVGKVKITIKYGARALHAGYLRICNTDCSFQGNNDYANAPICYVIVHHLSCSTDNRIFVRVTATNLRSQSWKINISTQLTLNIPNEVPPGPQTVIFCDAVVTIKTDVLLIFVCVRHQLKVNIV